MKTGKSRTKRIAALCFAFIRANRTKILWLTGLFLVLLPIHLVNFIFCWLLIGLMMKTEDECRIEALYCSLPIRRSEIVISRFLVSLGIILASILMGFLVLEITSIFLVFYPGKLCITKNIFFLLFPIILVISIFFPLYSRYGHRSGIQFSCYMASIMVTAAWLGILYIIGSISSGSWYPGSSAGKNSPVGLAFAIIERTIDIFGVDFFYIFLVVTMALFISISFGLSMKFYSRREF